MKALQARLIARANRKGRSLLAVQQSADEVLVLAVVMCFILGIPVTGLIIALTTNVFTFGWFLIAPALSAALGIWGGLVLVDAGKKQEEVFKNADKQLAAMRALVSSSALKGDRHAENIVKECAQLVDQSALALKSLLRGLHDTPLGADNENARARRRKKIRKEYSEKAVLICDQLLVLEKAYDGLKRRAEARGARLEGSEVMTLAAASSFEENIRNIAAQAENIRNKTAEDTERNILIEKAARELGHLQDWEEA